MYPMCITVHFHVIQSYYPICKEANTKNNMFVIDTGVKVEL